MNDASQDNGRFAAESALIFGRHRSYVPMTMAGWKPLCMKWLFPGLILALVIGPQPWARPLFIGQLIVIVNDLAAMIIVLATFRARIWPRMLVCCIVIAKVLSIVSAIAGIAYILFADILLCLAGGVVAFQLSRLVYKQVMVICIVSVPFMIMQCAGVGGFSQLLSTQYYDFKTAPDVQNTLFVPLENIDYDVNVFRPPGLLRTGTLLSLVVLFALAFHFSRSSGRFPGGTAALCAMVVLSMGKIVFLGFAVIILYFLFKGNRVQKYESLKAIGFTLCFFYLYSFFFPGLFEHNLGESTINYSIFVRLNDIVEILPEGNVARKIMEPFLAGTPRSTHLKAGEHVSGIPILIVLLPFLLPFLVILAINFLRGFRRLRVQFPNLASMCVPILLGLLMYPGAFPIWETGLYWFMMSFALLPLFFKLFPRYFRKAPVTPS